MRRIFLGLLLAVAGLAQAADGEHVRGDFSFRVGAEPAFVVRHPLPASWEMESGDDGGSWRYWLYDVQADRRSGEDRRYVELAYEPRSTASLGEAGRFEVTFIPEYQQLVFHRVELRRDGVWEDRLFPDKISLARREGEFENDIANGAVSALVVLDDVRVGDVVRIGYTVEGSNPILSGQTSDWIRTGWGTPVLDIYVRVLEDPDVDVRTYLAHGAPQPQVRSTPNATEVSLHDHAVAAILYEGDYPFWYWPYPAVQIAVDQSWGDVVNWALPLYPQVEQLPASLVVRIGEWRQLSDPVAKVRAALRAVQDEVRYFGVEMGVNTHRPTAPSETWNRRYGDCKDKAYLLVTLLRRLGIEAAPALVSAGRGRAIRDFLPSASVFDHVVVRANLDDEVLWLDPTVRQQGGDPRASDLSRYAFALPVEAGRQDLQAIEPVQMRESGIQVKEHYAPKAGGGLELAITTTYRGNSADHVRQTLLNERTDEISRRYANYYRRQFGELSVLDPPRINDDRRGNVVEIREHYLLADPFEPEGALQTLEVYAEALKNGAGMPSVLERNGPLGYLLTDHYRHEIDMEVPEKWIPTFDAESTRHVSPAFAYSRSVEVEDGRVALVHDLEVKRAFLRPGEVAEHVSALRKVNEELWATLRFNVPQQLERSERQARLRALLRGVMGDSEGGANDEVP